MRVFFIDKMWTRLEKNVHGVFLVLSARGGVPTHHVRKEADEERSRNENNNPLPTHHHPLPPPPPPPPRTAGLERLLDGVPEGPAGAEDKAEAVVAVARPQLVVVQLGPPQLAATSEEVGARHVLHTHICMRVEKKTRFTGRGRIPGRSHMRGSQCATCTTNIHVCVEKKCDSRGGGGVGGDRDRDVRGGQAWGRRLFWRRVWPINEVKRCACVQESCGATQQTQKMPLCRQPPARLVANLLCA